MWFEEPVSSRDLSGLAHVRRHAEADVTRCGGFTGWRRVASLAQAFERPVSTHCAPAPALSVQVAGCAPTLAYLEWFRDHTRLKAMLFDGAPVVTGGVVAPNGAAGHGMSLRPDAEQWWLA